MFSLALVLTLLHELIMVLFLWCLVRCWCFRC